MDEKSDADIMADAREYLEKNGWWRGHLLGPNGRQVCGMGAVVYSQGWEKEVSPLGTEFRNRSRVLEILGKVVDAWGIEGYGEFTNWNDNHAKNKQEVLDAFAKAEKIERAGFDPDA